MITGTVQTDFPLVPEQLASLLQRAIIFGEVEPGARLTEDEVALRYRVSRSPVREAIRKLEADGLVVREDRRSARVSLLTRRNLDEVYACRVPLEGLAAAGAARCRTAAQVVDIESGLARLESSFSGRDIQAYFEANVLFSESVYAAADNATLRRLLSGVGKQALRYRYLAYQAYPHLMDRSIEGSRDILGLIRAGNADGARAMTEGMIERSWRTIRDYVAE